MRGLLPSVWLLGAALYTALTLVLSGPAIEHWPLPPRVNETVIAKQPPKAAMLIFQDEPHVELAAAAAPAAATRVEWRDEWAQIAGYTTVGRLHPSSTSPVLFAYSVGRPLRVISREGGFARVQDLGSGQLGWVRETLARAVYRRLPAARTARGGAGGGRRPAGSDGGDEPASDQMPW